MNLSKSTIKYLIKYLAGIYSISPSYNSGDEVIQDFQEYFLFTDYKPDELRYSIEEALHDGLNQLNNNTLLIKYLNSRIDKRLFLINQNIDFVKSIKLLNEILLSNGYGVIKSKDGVYRVTKMDKSHIKEEYPDALWALADDLRFKKDNGEFSTYEEAYAYGAANYTHNGATIKARSLRNEWQKARSAGRV